MPRLFIEASPGAGKTTVAAERYGLLRFTAPLTSGAICALSFTRSATAEVLGRISDRWGTASSQWPHQVATIDTFVCDLVQYLLRRGLIRWPEGHTSPNVFDGWRGHRGARWLVADDYRYVATLSIDGLVGPRWMRRPHAGNGITTKAAFVRHLAAGDCTHEDVRAILAAALRRPALRAPLADFLRWRNRHLIVDEVFDANPLDVELIELACEADVSVTAVGDPWQAVYAFRGSSPADVRALLVKLGFQQLPLTQSFRFRTDGMRTLCTALRAGQAVSLRSLPDPEVVLAKQWDHLWDAGPTVLPLSLGRVSSLTDAAMLLLLDQALQARFGEHAVFLGDALSMLQIEPSAYAADGAVVVGAIMADLADLHAAPGASVLSGIRDAVVKLGARRPRATAHDGDHLIRLGAIRDRLHTDDALVRGLTIHQAKGRQWDRVGVRLTAADHHHLTTVGLSQEVESDRILYVALTRARDETGLV